MRMPIPTAQSTASHRASMPHARPVQTRASPIALRTGGLHPPPAGSSVRAASREMQSYPPVRNEKGDSAGLIVRASRKSPVSTGQTVGANALAHLAASRSGRHRRRPRVRRIEVGTHGLSLMIPVHPTGSAFERGRKPIDGAGLRNGMGPQSSCGRSLAVIAHLAAMGNMRRVQGHGRSSRAIC